MKHSLILLAVGTLGITPVTRGDDLPKRPEFTRYATMLEHSPFAIATAPVQAPTAPNWSKDLYIGNAGRTTEGDFITLLSGGDKNLHEYLSTIEPNSHGYSIANIQWSDNQGETKVTISKDGQYATIGFNQALMATSPIGGMSGPLSPNVVMPKPMPTTATTPAPHTRGDIVRNPRVPGAPAMATPFTPPKTDN